MESDTVIDADPGSGPKGRSTGRRQEAPRKTPARSAPPAAHARPGPSGPPLLKVENLTKRFGGKVAVSDMSLTLRPGGCLGVVGPNGAGKTTLIRTICTLLYFKEGKIEVGGHDIKKEPVEAKRLFGYVAEVPNPYELLTVREHISFIARAYGMTGWQGEAERMIDEFDLREKRDEFVKYLSKGQKQKLTIICAFIHRPRLLLLDEPIIGIDAKGVRALKVRIRRLLNGGGAVVISAHMLHFVEDMASRIMIIDRGRRVAEGTLEELKEKYFTEGDLEDLVIKITTGDK